MAPGPDDAAPLEVGLAAWIVQDGNHGDFTVGQEARFALELELLEPLRPARDAGPPEAVLVDPARYRVRARVAFVSPRAWVLDAGRFLAYQTSPPAGVQAGQLLEGEVGLGIDPFLYAEGLHALPGMPALTCRWRVEALHRETTPWVPQVLPDGTRVLARDASRRAFEAVTATDAWHDEDGNAQYVLRCLRVGGPERPPPP